MTHVSGPISIEPESLDEPPPLDVLDLCDVSDPFNVGRLIASRMLPGGPDKCVRIFLSLMDGPRIMSSVAALLIATNILQLTACFIKKAPESPELMLVICSRASREAPNVSPIEFPRSADLTAFVSDVFSRVYGGSPVSLEIGDEAYLLVKCMGIVCYEALQDGTVPILHTDLQASTSVVGGVRVIIAQADSALRARIARIVKTAPDDLKSTSFTARLNAYSGSVIEIATANSDLVQLANATIRSFMAGFCVVQFSNEDSFSPNLVEIALITAKYFTITMSVFGGGFHLTRASTTVDPVVPPQPVTPALDIADSESVTAAAVTVVNALVKSGTKLRVSIHKSVALLCGIVGVLGSANATEIAYELSTKSTKILVEIRLKEPLPDVTDLIAQLTEPTGDVSPSNYRPVDASIRQGSDGETAAFKSKLASLTENDAKRVSVLLVGPWNIGLGIRLLTQGYDDPEFEFIAERAVRDAQGVNLKCAARLFIARNRMDRSLFESLLNASAIVEVAEADSRITIANRLFTFLNEAPNSNPFVLVRADGDYCAFIAAMSVVVANGWSRSIHQRVECRVVANADTIFFITRLIVNL